MSISVSLPQEQASFRPRIVVMGVGGAGGNAVHNMIRSQLEGVDFMLANTDAQAMQLIPCDVRIQLGRQLTAGLGAGSDPNVGHKAAEESAEEVAAALAGSHMVFITAGMGGGTGTGAAPVIAQIARSMGILTVGITTKPFTFEGQRRQRLADEGIEQMAKHVDTLLVIPNQNLFRVANDQTTFADAFRMADEILYTGVRSISDLMTRPGLVNLDFADVRSLMTMAGKAMLGAGEASGESRAIEAAEAAIFNPLLDDVSINGANGALINIAGGSDMSLFEVDAAASRIKNVLAPDANVIFGASQSSELDGKIRVSLVATGIQEGASAQTEPQAPSLAGLEAMSSGPRLASSMAATEISRTAAAPAVGDESPSFQPQPVQMQAPSQPQLASDDELGLAGNPFAAFSVSRRSSAQPQAQPFEAASDYSYDPEDQHDDDLMNLPGMGPQPSIAEAYEPIAVGQSHGAGEPNLYAQTHAYPADASQPSLPASYDHAPQAAMGSGFGGPTTGSDTHQPSGSSHTYADQRQAPRGQPAQIHRWAQPGAEQPHIGQEEAEAWVNQQPYDVTPDQPNPLRADGQSDSMVNKSRPHPQQGAQKARGLGGFAARMMPFGNGQSQASQPTGRSPHSQPSQQFAPSHQPHQAHGAAHNEPSQPEAWPGLVVDNNDLSRMDEELIDIPAFLRRQAN